MAGVRLSRRSLVTTTLTVVVAAVLFSNAALAQSQISETASILAQEQCIKAANAKGFTVKSIDSTQVEKLVNTRSSSMRVVLTLTLEKSGSFYVLTCPLTIAEDSPKAPEALTLVAAESVPRDGASATSAIAPKTAQSRRRWWLLLPLAGMGTLIWFLSKQGSKRQVITGGPTAPSDIQPLSSPLPVPPAPRLETSEANSPPAPGTFSRPEAFPPEVESRRSEMFTEAVFPRDSQMVEKDRDYPQPEQPVADLADEPVLQVVEEEMTVGTQLIERGRVRVVKRVESWEEVVNTPIIHDRVVVERVPINQVVEGDVPAERDEAGSHIIPIFAEVVVTENRLYLREEVHISKRRLTDTVSETLALRQEVVDVNRLPGDSQATGASATAMASPSSQMELVRSVPLAAAVPVAQAATTTSAIAPPQPLEDAVPPLPRDTELADPFTAEMPEPPVSTLAEEIVIPVVAEEIALSTQQVARTRVQVHKRVETHQQMVSTPAMYEQLVIEHVPIHRFVEGDAPVEREEQGVRIIPILEEVVVSTTKLLLKEEVRISKQQTTENISQTVTLRREVVDIEQTSSEDAEPA